MLAWMHAYSSNYQCVMMNYSIVCTVDGHCLYRERYISRQTSQSWFFSRQHHHHYPIEQINVTHLTPLFTIQWAQEVEPQCLGYPYHKGRKCRIVLIDTASPLIQLEFLLPHVVDTSIIIIFTKTLGKCLSIHRQKHIHIIIQLPIFSCQVSM